MVLPEVLPIRQDLTVDPALLTTEVPVHLTTDQPIQTTIIQDQLHRLTIEALILQMIIPVHQVDRLTTTIHQLTVHLAV
jgi:hypothetical protein